MTTPVYGVSGFSLASAGPCLVRLKADAPYKQKML